MTATAQKVASKYLQKKEVPKADGDGTTTVYEYSEQHVRKRHKEKAERYEGLSKNIGKLRAKVDRDLGSKDPKVRLTALAVGLIDAVYERVGNDSSADEGHYGVTGWLKEHVTFSKGKARIKYVGKSGVEHDKEVTDKKLVSALRGCCEDKKPDEPLLSFGKDDSDGVVQVTSRDVNAYLEPYDISAKDLRGFHANSTMQEELLAARKRGGKLPDDKKEREKLLKAEFKEALEATAEAVGHEPSTLKSQYLVPGMEDQYLKDGTVNDKLKGASAIRIAAQYLQSSKDPCDGYSSSTVWISPDGVEYVLSDSEDHLSWAEARLRGRQGVVDAQRYLLEHGWVRVSNYTSIETDTKLPPERAMAATVDLILGCAYGTRPDQRLDWDRGAIYERHTLESFVLQWGGKKAEERLFGRVRR